MTCSLKSSFDQRQNPKWKEDPCEEPFDCVACKFVSQHAPKTAPPVEESNRYGRDVIVKVAEIMDKERSHRHENIHSKTKEVKHLKKGSDG